MKWHKKFKPLPKDGETREITRFLWFPKCIDSEWRWLEKASWEQYYLNLSYASFLDRRWFDRKWVQSSDSSYYKNNEKWKARKK